MRVKRYDTVIGHGDSGELTVVAVTHRGRRRLPAISGAGHVGVVLLVALLHFTAVATAHQPFVPVLVQAHSSGHTNSPIVAVAVQSIAYADCRLTVIADHRSVSFPAMIANDRGRLAVTWQVPAGAPSGRWTFIVSCTYGQRTRREIDHAFVLHGGRKSTDQLIADSSSQLLQGDLASARARTGSDSYANSCSFDVCFANDLLWRASGESAWYALGRRPDLGGIVDDNAGNWLKEARDRVPEGTTPAIGAIAVWLPNSGGASSTGHVAYVAGLPSVSDARVLVEDSNWGQPGLRVHRRWVPASSISGYVYGGPAGSGPPAAASSPPPAAALTTTPGSFTAPLAPVNTTGGAGTSAPPPSEESIPSDPGPGVPAEGPSGSGGNPPTPPLQATLPPTPAAPMPESLTSVLPQARQIMAQTGTVWSKAAAVRNLVRASLSGVDCGVMATAFWSVGSIVGLPLRLVDSSVNGQNDFDTHSTVEVWLAGLGRWAISDPTFNGYWSAAPEGPPVSAEFLQRAVRASTNNMLYWHSANTPNSILPSQYYVDPTYLYAYIDFLAFVPSLGSTFIVESEADAFSAPDVLVPTTTINFESLPPDAQTPVTVYPRTEAPSSAGARDFTLPPSYAGGLVYEGQVTVGPGGRVALPLAEQTLATVVSVDTNSGHWQVEIGGGTTYNLDPYPKARVSPMIFFIPPAYLVATGAMSGPATVRIWTVKGFPSSREVTSQWDGG